jgi:hypothetical protein
MVLKNKDKDIYSKIQTQSRLSTPMVELGVVKGCIEMAIDSVPHFLKSLMKVSEKS